MILYEGILEQFIPVIGSILTSIILAGMAALVKYLVSKTKNEKLQSALAVMGDIGLKTVEALMQSEVEVMKERATDGKLSEDDRKLLKETAIKTIRQVAPNETLKYLQQKQMDMDRFLNMLVEASVRETKNGQ